MDDVTIRVATADDRLAISILLDTAFEGQAEAMLVEDLRAQNAMALELVAFDKESLVGHVAFSELEKPSRWVALAPLSVRNDHRGRGIGSRLVEEGLDIVRQRHAPAVVVLGDPPFYRKFGFSLEAARNLKTEYPAQNFMVYPLEPHTAGSQHEVVYHRAFRYL
ncbi:MAG: N-acetyltransferase [Dinoroseobacter sp.]|nr:N-acetyltransferase [Dinoroseobacter sp.]